ncbi:MAG: hypothetical protein HFJ30_10540 [Clostridia bacterium]|jgi:hypothetical protein|nr:hypothetical protein [Clostridia bacterium]
MKEPDISDNFTIEDIHTVREYNAKRRQKMELKERLEDIKKSADKCEEDIEKCRKKGLAI